MEPSVPEELRIGLLFHCCYVKTRHAVDPVIKPLNLNLRHIWVMRTAQEQLNKSQLELARYLEVNENVFVRLVNDLERMGYVERLQAGEDARARIVSVTESGNRICDVADNLIYRTYERLLAGFTASERLTLYRLLKRFIAGA